AIERGRPPAVDFLNGEVVSRGAALGIATPINAAIRDQVLAIARGEAKPAIDLLRRFFDRTRALVGAPASAEPPSAPINPPYPPQPVEAPPSAEQPPAEQPPVVEQPLAEPPLAEPPVASSRRRSPPHPRPHEP